MAYLVHYTLGFYPYDFLDYKIMGNGVTAAYIVAIAVAGIVSFLIGQALISTREFVAAKLQGSGKAGSAKPRGVPLGAITTTDSVQEK